MESPAEKRNQEKESSKKRGKTICNSNRVTNYNNNYLLPLFRFRNLYDENKKRQGYMDEAKKQKFIKETYKVTNQIPNYFNPKSFKKGHKRSWWPNGQYLIKRRYNYTPIGLEHYYEYNNVEELRPIDTELKENKDSDISINPLEFENVAPGNFIITIEYCSSCEDHSGITQHGIENIFQELALRYKKIIKERFPFIKVLLKPTDVDIVIHKPLEMTLPEKNGSPYPKLPYINEQFKECRIGAFEIKITKVISQKETITKIIHSKLKTKLFPNVKAVLDKIVSMMPLFDLNIVLFDQEDYQELDKMNGIEVSIYLSNSNNIRELSDGAKEQISNFISPGRRNEMLQRQKLIQAQNFNRFQTDKNFLFDNRTIVSSKTRRLYSTKSHIRTNSKSKTGSYSYKKLPKNNSNLTLDIFSSNKSGHSSDINGVNINDYKILKKQRGLLIKKQFSKIDKNLSKEEYYDSSESVSVIFNSLPYDTYIVETKENSNFQSSITLLKFNEINTKDNGTVTKYIGLWHQQKAILNIHLYKEIEVEAQNTDNNSNVNKKLEQIPITTGTITISDADDPNSRYQVYSNSKGIYEYKTQPGEYKLEVYTKDFERDVRKIKLKYGLNTINIKLNPDNNCELTIEVLEYNETMNDGEEKKNDNNSNMELIPVRNARVQIFKNSQDLLMEGITNKKGLMKYLVDRNDNNLSIKITKDGYFRAERFFKKYSNMKVNDNGNYVSTMRFILVNQKRLNYFKTIIFICYANVNKKIFEFKYESGHQKNKIQIKDWQKEKGIFIATFRHDEENQCENVSKTENSSKIIIKNGKNSNNDEKCTYEEIIRIGLQISPNSIKSDDNNYNMDDFKVTDRDLIEYLRNVCCEGNVYSPKSDFHINLPKVFNKLNANLNSENSKRAEILTINNNNNLNNSQNEENISKKETKRVINDLYWDLGWIDARNFIYYETSVFFDIEQKPNRLTYYECFLEFLQALIDKQVYNSLFDYFHFNLSILARGDRYLPKKIFEKKMLELIIFEEKNENMEELIGTINFVCNILCGYDEENNIRDDSISFNLLKKKVSSNIINFID